MPPRCWELLFTLEAGWPADSSTTVQASVATNTHSTSTVHTTILLPEIKGLMHTTIANINIPLQIFQTEIYVTTTHQKNF